MKTLYSCSFDLASRSNADAADTHALARRVITSWVVGKYERPQDKGGWATPISLPDTPVRFVPLPHHEITQEFHAAADGELFSLTWDHPDDKDTDAMWSSQVLLSHNGKTVNFTIHTRLASRRFVLRPSSYDVGIPRVVREMLKSFLCSLDGWPIQNRETVLQVGDVERFVDESLLCPKRPIPTIVISPDAWTDRPIVKPLDWCNAVGGFANITVLGSKWASFRLTESVGKQLSCFGGAVRIYWPGLQLESAPQPHRLWLPSEIKLRSAEFPIERALFRFLSAIAVTRHVDSPVLLAFRRALDASRDSEREKMITAVRAHKVEKGDLENQLLEALTNNNELRQKLDEARLDLEQQRESWAQMQSYLAEQPTSEDSQPAKAKESPEPTEFTSVLEAYECAEKQFGGLDSPLVFLESAKRSAADSPYNNPELVYELLKELHALASLWKRRKGNLGQPWEAALAPTGFEYKPRISPTTKGKFGNEYRFSYDGLKPLFEEHITKGAKNAHSCFSVHLYRDVEKLRLVIGHCGKHLSTTTT